MPTKKSVKSSSPAPQKNTTSLPGKDFATAGFAVAVTSIFVNIFTLGVMAIVGLVLSVIGRIQTSKAGQPSSLALAGIIISSISAFFTFIAFIYFVVLLVFADVNPMEVLERQELCREQYANSLHVPVECREFLDSSRGRYNHG